MRLPGLAKIQLHGNLPSTWPPRGRKILLFKPTEMQQLLHFAGKVRKCENSKKPRKNRFVALRYLRTNKLRKNRFVAFRYLFTKKPKNAQKKTRAFPPLFLMIFVCQFVAFRYLIGPSHCYSATLLLCYSATLLLCYSATLLLCYSATLLLCYSATLLMSACSLPIGHYAY